MKTFNLHKERLKLKKITAQAAEAHLLSRRDFHLLTAIVLQDGRLMADLKKKWGVDKVRPVELGLKRRRVITISDMAEARTYLLEVIDHHPLYLCDFCVSGIDLSLLRSAIAEISDEKVGDVINMLYAYTDETIAFLLKNYASEEGTIYADDDILTQHR